MRSPGIFSQVCWQAHASVGERHKETKKQELTFIEYLLCASHDAKCKIYRHTFAVCTCTRTHTLF